MGVHELLLQGAVHDPVCPLLWRKASGRHLRGLLGPQLDVDVAGGGLEHHLRQATAADSGCCAG